MKNQLLCGDSEEVLKGFADQTFDACVTDPPYGLGAKEPTGPEIDSYLAGESALDTQGDFMGKDWQIPKVALWREVYRTLKEGAVVMAFAGTRTLDLMAAGIEAAGFQYVGTLAWMHGQGFPKSLNIAKAIDASLLAGGSHSRHLKQVNEIRPGESRDTATLPNNGVMSSERRGGKTNDNPATDEAKRWDGWGTALKPSWEPVLVFSRGPTTWEMPSVPFFYCAKAAKAEKDLEGEVKNNHVTVKPVKLMEWLVGLAAPSGASVLEPFLGSGTTAVVCAAQGRAYVGIERDPAYFELASQRAGIVQDQNDVAARQREAFDMMDDLPEE